MMNKKEKEIQITTILGKNAIIDGDFQAEGSVRLDGVVRGNVKVDQLLIVGATGSIEGSVTAKAVIVGGEILGNVEAPEKVELTSTAKILGDITTNAIVIDEHAVFQGRCDMNQPAQDRRIKTKAVRTAKKTAKAAIVEALKEMEEANEDTNDVTIEENLY